ncbi:hypothetical protein PCASD_07637 [Puccinia coronata f. sp. avenae]|uniref:Uncharacterized protein n=1 Tax=Puccinia coronata f. sp. avenae TaxID=200324 RepID=A0A2N5UN67_9BASI|nr:hypothetical protein PCASD_07637 [Puccinia coronata f. sp. avenae]
MNSNFQSNSEPTHPMAAANLNLNIYPQPMAAANLNHNIYPQPSRPPPVGSYYQSHPNLSSHVIPHGNFQLVATASGDINRYIHDQSYDVNSNDGFYNTHGQHRQHIHQQQNQEENQPNLAPGTPATPNIATEKHDNRTSGPNMREINHLLKGLAKDRQPPSPLPADQLVPVPALAGSPPNVGPNGATNQLIPTILNVEERKQPEDKQQEDDCLPQLPEDVMEEISAMDLDELCEYEALHATSRRLPAYLKAELDEIYYEFERQLHIIAIRHQLHTTLLYTHIGQMNQMRGATNYNNFCRFDPQAREIFSAKDQELKQRCKEVAKVWNAMEPNIKMKYKDPDYLESIRGDVPITVVNGIVQTARKTHVASTTLNLASNKKSISFVRRWAKETTDQGFLVISSARSSGDLYIQGGSRMGVNFLNMLICSGDPLRKFHTYVAGMSVAEELTGEEVTFCPTGNREKRKPGKMERSEDVNSNNKKADKYCSGSIGVKKFRGWPGKNAARNLKAAHVNVQIKANDNDFHANELFQPINAISVEESYRILRAIGEGWIRLTNSTEDGDGEDPPKDASGAPKRRRGDGDGEEAPKGASGVPKRRRIARKNLSNSLVDSDASLDNNESRQDEDSEDNDFDRGNDSDE